MTLNNARREWEEAGTGLKNLNPYPPCPAPWCGTKVLPYPRPRPTTTFARWRKPTWSEAERSRLSGDGKKLPSLLLPS